MSRNLELILVSVATLVYIWFIRYDYPWGWIVLLIIMGISCVIRNNTFREIGIAPRSPFYGIITIIVLLMIFISAIAIVGYLYGTKPLLSLSDFAQKVTTYYPWAFLQQLILNGYFINTLFGATKKLPFDSSLRSTSTSMFVGGFSFFLIHIPNPALMIITLINGVPGVYIFMKYRNIYTLSLAHAIIAVSVMNFLPYEWHHNLSIGPKF